MIYLNALPLMTVLRILNQSDAAPRAVLVASLTLFVHRPAVAMEEGGGKGGGDPPSILTPPNPHPLPSFSRLSLFLLSCSITPTLAR